MATDDQQPASGRVRYPEMRAEVVEALRALSDPDYQERVWARGEYPAKDYYDDLTMNVHTLFDDVCVLPNPYSRVGTVLYPDEVDALNLLGERLELVIAALGDANDARYLDHAQWSAVISAARDAHQQLRPDDTR